MKTKTLSLTYVWTTIKSVLVGALAAESFQLSWAFHSRIDKSVRSAHLETAAFMGGAIGLALLLYYLTRRSFFSAARRVAMSCRIDVFAATTAGVVADMYLGGISQETYANAASHIGDRQMVALFAAPFVMGSAVALVDLHAYFTGRRRRKLDQQNFFIADKEVASVSGDLLGTAEDARRFADRVVNRNSSQSIAFGIDAPWGIGKSSFVNFCAEQWMTTYRDNVLVYKFNPLRFEGRVNLLENFVDGLIRTIQQNAFLPEARPLISRYSRFLKGAKGKVLGIDVELLSDEETLDDAFESLELVLQNFGKKVIVVVDDLDRLTLPAVMDVLFAVKKCFTLPNISYLLCYDTENFGALEGNALQSGKISEFLEKFVNVKISMYIDSKVLRKYATENLATALSGNSESDPALVSKAMGGLVNIFDSRDFHRYQSLVGDIRKLKRLINTLLLLQVESTDFENDDFNAEDLIHLLLIYINYPRIFRTIYGSETEARNGFFSVLGPYDLGYPKTDDEKRTQLNSSAPFRNSKEYIEYVQTLSAEQRFLLDKVFSPSSRFTSPAADSVSMEIRRSYACFNGATGTSRNLEQYLHLIVKSSKPQRADQYRFYLNCKDRIRKKIPLATVLTIAEFQPDRSESPHEHLWRVLVNSARDFDSETGSQLITDLLERFPLHSLFVDSTIGVGLRDDLGLYLAKLIDAAGWSDGSGLHALNTPENLTEIAEWVFGEGRHMDMGVIDVLSHPNRGVIGFFDLLAFRLYCSADRGGDTYNLQRALSLHGSPFAPTSGLTTEIAKEEMREISQRVFAAFQSRFIEPSVNLFDAIDALTMADCTGAYHDYVVRMEALGRVPTVTNRLAALKSMLKSFMIYQLGNGFISSGVGCGFYDPTGKDDKNGIADRINDYLLNVCFNPNISIFNYEHFLCYLLINLSSTWEFGGGRAYAPSLNEFTKVLIRNRLVAYWRDHRESIRASNFEQQDKEVFTQSYVAKYRDDLASVYAVLDELVDSPVAAPIAPLGD